MRASPTALLFGLAIAACDRPSPLLICHNSNCTGPDVSRDDTLPALDEGLQQTYDGLPVLDGVEIDTFWYGAESRCLFAHDPPPPGTAEIPVTDAALHIATYLDSTARPSHNGERFYVFIEIKANVGDAYSDAHTAEQFVEHAECVLDAMSVIAAPARSNGSPITIGVLSSAPEALRVLAARSRWQAYAGDPDVDLMLIADIFAPYSSVVPHLTDYDGVPLDAVEYHPDFMTQGRREAYRSLGLDLVEWSYTTTPESLDALARWNPRFEITNDSLLLRRWIED